MVSGVVLLPLLLGVVVQLVFVKGTQLNTGTLPYLEVAIATAMILFALSWLVARAQAGSCAQRARPSVRHGDVTVSLDHVEWESLGDEALILMARIRVQNDGDVRLGIQGMALHAESAELMFREPGDEVAARAYELKQTRPRIVGEVAAHDYGTGWFVASFRHRPEGGRPSFDIVVEDDERTQYALHVPQREPTLHVSDPAARRRVFPIPKRADQGGDDGE